MTAVRSAARLALVPSVTWHVWVGEDGWCATVTATLVPAGSVVPNANVPVITPGASIDS